MTPQPASDALNNARRALLEGDRHAARQWAEKAALLAPESEDPWLFLAASASPRASIIYLQRALQINPRSKRARQGMHWAAQRLRSSQIHAISAKAEASHTQPVRLPPTRPAQAAKVTTRSRAFFYLGGAAALMALAVLLLAVAGWPWISSALAGNDSQAQALADSPTPSSTPTAFLPAATASATASPAPTLTFTPTSTFTAAPTLTATLPPTLPPTATLAPGAAPLPFRPDGVAADEFWVEVDLSQQMLYAYQGDQLLSSFVVSTGKAGTPTVTGSYQVYVKYQAADMWGPGYYLPGVPYVMYFYEGYGLHGTYWHNSFGVPTSHGCINLRTDDAAWLFKWVKIGTVVYIHK